MGLLPLISAVNRFVALMLFFFFGGRCFCTTVVFLFEPSRIVVGGDRLLENQRPGGPTTATKVALLKGRL